MASLAQHWSERCVDEYGSDHDVELGEVGQINWVGDGPVDDTAGVVDDWFHQSRHYDHDRQRCQAGKTCTDYTQVLIMSYIGTGNITPI